MTKGLYEIKNRQQADREIIKKYTTQGPRYTSYPPVPFWNTEAFGTAIWQDEIRKSARKIAGGISVYIHLPYCESLCTFCACHKRITKNHEVENSYIDAVLKEWQLYLHTMPVKPVIRELHLGGGTPSFFAPANLERLLQGIINTSEIAPDHEFSFEGHPNNTSAEHLQTLYDLGFRRVSFGVQDYDARVQEAIHRVQPFENVKYVTEKAREIGYTSISHDLVFGLPFQSLNAIDHTISKTLKLNPDRIAFYSYAHVPWLKGNGQRGFDENDLPSGANKRVLYEYGLTSLEEGGYVEVGMDHFALPHDELFKAMNAGTLNRNFMGYTTSDSKILIGLGVSSISDSGEAFAQNIKDIDTYKKCVEEGVLPLEKGHLLTTEDLFVREQITNIMCRFETSWPDETWTAEERTQIFDKLEGLAEDGLIVYHAEGLRVTEKGRPFIRNISMVFDQYLNRADLRKKMFSETV